MIVEVTDNMVSECIELMKTSYSQNEYSAYDYNERCWIEHLVEHVREQTNKNPRYLAIADYDTNKGYIKGFMLASAFVNFYTQEWVMDVKDCIVDHEYNNAFTVARLFDHMIAHTKAHGGKHWRADSIRSADKAEGYAKFLKKRYNAVPFHGVHGRID